AEVVAAGTIAAADMYGLPVSTTHVLSSGVAGTMAANGSGLQWATVRNLLMAWVLTLPAAIMLSAILRRRGPAPVGGVRISGKGRCRGTLRGRGGHHEGNGRDGPRRRDRETRDGRRLGDQASHRTRHQRAAGGR